MHAQRFIESVYRDCHTGNGIIVRCNSFQQFHCFCSKLYYFSNYKDFNTQAPALAGRDRG